MVAALPRSAAKAGVSPYLVAVLVSFAIIAGVTACEAVVEFGGWTRLKRRRVVRVGWALAVLLVTLVLGEFEGGQFVYVRF